MVIFKKFFAHIFIYTLITVSALSFAFSLFFPAKLSFLAFLFLIPVFYLFFHKKTNFFYGFLYGFIWGIIFFSLHFCGYILLFYKEAHGLFRIFIPIILALYCALYSGLWFFLSQKSVLIFKNNLLAKYISLILWAHLYFSWVRYGIFWIFGEFVGYPFAHPLLPLAYSAKSLYFMCYFGKSLFLIFFITFALFISLFFIYFKKRYIIAALFFISPFLLSKLYAPNISKSFCNLGTIGYISPISSQKCNHPLDCAQEIYYEMVKLLDKNPEIKIIVMPESSYNFCLNTHTDIIDLWYKNILGEDITLIIGAPYKEGKKIYNALYYMAGGKIKKIYKKTRLMAFAEYVPDIYKNIIFLKNLFCDTNNLLSPNNSNLAGEDVTFDIVKDIAATPRICSDFFMCKRKEAQKLTQKDFLLLAVNDQIFPAKYLRDLLFLYAKLEGISRQIDILYVGYYFAAFLPKESASMHFGSS